MKCWSPLLQRFYSSPRSATISKGLKSELTFKESNIIPNPYDIIDQNVPGIKKRLSLFEMRRLREQLELDHAELESLKLINYPLSNENGENSKSIYKGIELSYSVLTNFPGLNFPSESSLDSNVTFRIPLDYFEISELECKKISEIMKIDSDSKIIEFKVSDFPFVSQNKSRAIEIFSALINTIKNQNDSFYNNLSILKSDFKTENPKKRKSDHSKISPEFPVEWLHNLEKSPKNE